MTAQRLPRPKILRHTASVRRRAGTQGNSVSLLVDGEQTFAAMLTAYDAAVHVICVESYTFAGDATGKRFVDALLKAARRGVRVYVLIDGVGSMGTPPALFAPLKQAGAEVEIFHPLKLWGPLRVLWRRDHRKLQVIDGAVGFIGGLNICDVHASVLAGGGGWHDMHARIEGPAVVDMMRLFCQTWRKTAGRRRTPKLPSFSPLAGVVTVELLDGLYRRQRSIRGAYLQAVRRAQHSIMICSAYFIPDRAFIKALIQARKRGVTVQVLLAGATDVVAVQWASRALYRRLLAHDIEIYEWQAQVLHAKTMVADASWCCIGSYNMDRRSLLFNLEANIACQDPVLSEALQSQFFADLQGSKRILAEAWHRRAMAQKIIERLFYFFRFWL